MDGFDLLAGEEYEIIFTSDPYGDGPSWAVDGKIYIGTYLDSTNEEYPHYFNFETQDRFPCSSEEIVGPVRAPSLKTIVSRLLLGGVNEEEFKQRLVAYY